MRKEISKVLGEANGKAESEESDGFIDDLTIKDKKSKKDPQITRAIVLEWIISFFNRLFHINNMKKI